MSHFFLSMAIVGASFFVAMDIYALKKKEGAYLLLIFAI